MTKRQMRRVREIVKNITLMIILVVIFCWCSWYETHYTREATVIDVTDNIITVVDRCDYTWSFEGDGFNVDDEVKLMMNTMHTDSNIFDDEIEDVKIYTQQGKHSTEQRDFSMLVDMNGLMKIKGMIITQLQSFIKKLVKTY